MSTRVMINSLRNVLATAVLFAICGSQNLTIANDSVKNQPAQVQYIGELQDGVLFKLNFLNEQEKTFSLNILNEDGEVLYSAKSKSKAFTQKFLVPKDYDGKLRFVIRSGKQTFTESFDIQQDYKSYKEVLVSKQ